MNPVSGVIPSHQPAKSVTAVATFWHGSELAALDLACLLSFARHGFEVKVYSYAPLHLPGEIMSGHAGEILDRSFLDAFIVNNRPSLSHFSDLFRYYMFQRTGEVWIDTDLLCLVDFRIPRESSFLTRETAYNLNGAILRLDRRDAPLDSIIEDAERFSRTRNFRWGSTGPALITKHMGGEALRSACEPHLFYPFPWDEWWKPFVPSEREWCEQASNSSNAIHLWNNIVERSGFWKDLAPPLDSFLAKTLQQQGLLDLFKNVMPNNVMHAIKENYIYTRTAANHSTKNLAFLLRNRLFSKIEDRLKRSRTAKGSPEKS